MIVRWTEAALAQLAAVEAYIANDSPVNARRMVERIFDRSQSLGDQPYLGGVVPEYDEIHPELREVIEYPYRIIYEVVALQVQVVAVVHGARRLPRRL